jgi:hypothetical protein
MESGSDYDGCDGIGGDGGASEARCSAFCMCGRQADRRPGQRRERDRYGAGRVGGVRCDYAVEEKGNGCWLRKSVRDEKLKC